jgi:peptidoglycan/xylan/chitin deacetylase (PgdA/CDA1 family)
MGMKVATLLYTPLAQRRITMPNSSQKGNEMPPFAQDPIIRLAKFLISAAFYIVREASRAVARLLGRRPPGLAVAIYYHQVAPHERANFARQMDHLLRWARPIPADRVEPLLPGERYAMVTADDGWASFVENALPELRARNIPVAIFVVADRMGDSLGEAADHIVSEAELHSLVPDMARGLVTIGSHTSTHACLTGLDRHEAWRELADSRARLEQILDREVKLFCFPFSIYSAEAVELCRDAGYERVFGGMPAPALRDTHEFLIGRMRVDSDDWLIEFHLKLMGAYDWVPFAADVKRRILDALHIGRSRDVRTLAPSHKADSFESRKVAATPQNKRRLCGPA